MTSPVGQNLNVCALCTIAVTVVSDEATRPMNKHQYFAPTQRVDFFLVSNFTYPGGMEG